MSHNRQARRASAVQSLTLAAGLAALMLSFQAGVSIAQYQPVKFQELPAELRSYVKEIRGRCKDLAEDPVADDSMQGIVEVDIDKDGQQDLIVDAEYLCSRRMAGANCTNRGCDFQIWREVGERRWQKIFDEHLYDRYISFGNSYGPLKFLVAKIYGGRPECKPDPSENYTSGMSCDVLVRYHDGKWTWEKLE